MTKHSRLITGFLVYGSVVAPLISWAWGQCDACKTSIGYDIEDVMTFLLNAPLPIPITFAVVFALTLENYDRVMVIGLYFAINIPLSIVTGHLVGVALSRFKPWKVWLLFGGSSVSIYSSFDLLARRVLFG